MLQILTLEVKDLNGETMTNNFEELIFRRNDSASIRINSQESWNDVYFLVKQQQRPNLFQVLSREIFKLRLLVNLSGEVKLSSYFIKNKITNISSRWLINLN
jgi:hypothetical protein